MPNKKTMTQIERELILDVSQEIPEAIRLIYSLRTIWHLTNYDYPYLEVLEYLRRTRTRGKKFVDTYRERFENSQVVAAAILQKEAMKDFKLRPMYAGGY